MKWLEPMAWALVFLLAVVVMFTAMVRKSQQLIHAENLPRPALRLQLGQELSPTMLGELDTPGAFADSRRNP